MKPEDVGPLWQQACDQATHEKQPQEVFAALVLEKAAQVASKGQEDRKELAAKNDGRQSDFAFGALTAVTEICDELRAMAEGLKP